jgi:hypothetical protein
MYKNAVPISKTTQSISLRKVNQLMLFREISGVYHEKHTKHINMLWKNVEFLNVTVGGVYGYHWPLNG